MIRAPGECGHVGAVLRRATLEEGVAAVDDQGDGKDDDDHAEREECKDLAARASRARVDAGHRFPPQLMTMDVDADIEIAPTICARIGVIGRNVPATRTEATLPAALLVQVLPVQLPVGVPPLGSHRTKTSDDVTVANGEIIRLAALMTSVFMAVAVAGQSGPPALPQPGSLTPIQLASTEARRAPSRAACDRTLCW